MKQHITRKQLNELSKLGRKKYRHLYPNNLGYSSAQWRLVPLLSIGQMIEFLDEKGEFKKIFRLWSKSEKKTAGKKYLPWMVDVSTHAVSSAKLCDALWEAVKEVLNEL